MEAEVERLKSELKQIKSEKSSLQTELDALKSKLSSTDNATKTIRPKGFWDDIHSKLIEDPDSVKTLIKEGKVNVHESGDVYAESNLLQLSAWSGAYEIAELCINLGADLQFKNKNGRTARMEAKTNNNDHIEQLLLLKETKSNIGDRIKYISQSILKQNGVIQSIMSELALIGETSKDLFVKILKEIMINLITKKLVFSDDLLNLCWKLESEKGDPLDSELWVTIRKTCAEIINGDSVRDWFWMKQCLLPSNVE